MFYVAITRAQDELNCYWAGTRRFGQHTVERKPSHLLDHLTGTNGSASPRTTRQKSAANARKLRESLGVTDTSTDQRDLRDDIRQWTRLLTAS